MAEELYFKINSDVSSAVSGTEKYVKTLESAEENVDELNKSLKAQNDFILQQEKELLRLQTAQSKVAKGSWNAGAIKRAEDIKNITYELKENKLALKGIKNEQKEATSEVKEFKKAQKESSIGIIDNIKNFKVMGVSVNGIGKAMKGVIPAIKAMFMSVKVGIASTGIGLIIVAVGSLIAWFTKTKVGAESLSKIFAGLGAVVSVLIDRMVAWWGVLKSIVTLDFSGVVEGLKATFGGLGDEIMKEIQLAIQLETRLQRLADATRSLNVETAQRKAEIQELKEKSQDLNLTEEERLAHLEAAAKIEYKLMGQRLDNAEQAIAIQKGQMSMSDNMAEDLDKLAELEINLANIRRESSKTTTTLLRRENAIRKSVAAEETKRQNAWIRKQNEITKANIKLKHEANAIFLELALRELDSDKKRERAVLKMEAKKQSEIIKMSKLTDAHKLLAQQAIDSLLESDLKKVNDKFYKIKVDAQKLVDQKLKELSDENYLRSIDDLRARADAELVIQAQAELDAIDLMVATDEEKFQMQQEIADKYKDIRQENADEEAEQDKERAEKVAAFKTQLLGKGLGVLTKVLKLEEKKITSKYDTEMKLAEGNEALQKHLTDKYNAEMRENAEKQKALKIGLAIIDTYQSAVAAYAAGLAVGGPAGLVLGPVSAGLAVAAGLANIAMIEQTPLGDFGGGGGGGGVTASIPTPEAAPPSPDMMGGGFSLSGGEAPEPIKAFVVTDEMTNSQNQLSNIRRRATI